MPVAVLVKENYIKIKYVDFDKIRRVISTDFKLNIYEFQITSTYDPARKLLPI